MCRYEDVQICRWEKNILILFVFFLAFTAGASVQNDTLWARATFIVIDQNRHELKDASVKLTDTLHETHRYDLMSGDTIKLPVGYSFKISCTVLFDSPIPVMQRDLIIKIKPHSQLSEVVYRYTISINVVKFPAIIFESGSAVLSQKEKNKLDNIIRFYQDSLYTSYNYAIKGYTDNIGSRAANLTLSQRRAEAVWNYIGAVTKTKYAVNLEWHCVAYFGEDGAEDSNETEQGRARNRRVSVSFLPRLYVTAGDPCK